MAGPPSFSSRARAALRELGLIALAGLTYAAVRAITEGSSHEAVANGRRVLRLERVLHLGWEQGLQARALGHPDLLRLANEVYIYAFWPVLAGAGVYLYFRHHDHYVLLRNAIFVSCAIGFLFFALLPVAPPRLADPDLVDTIRSYSGYYRSLEGSDLTNQYASLPSLHLGWSLLVGVMVGAASRRWIGYAFAVLLPAIMAVAVVVTANHYVIDVIAGAAVAVVSLALASRLSAHVTSRSRPAARERNTARTRRTSAASRSAR
jgi:membrane-associated phospholipid phosphatase